MPSLEPSPRTRLPRQDTSTTSASMASPRAGDASPRELDARVEGAVEQELWRVIHSERQLYGETVSDLRGFFRAIDRDDSGRVSRDELRQALARLDVRMPEEDMKSLIATMDTDRDGRVDWPEFKRWMTHLHQQAEEEEPNGFLQGCTVHIQPLDLWLTKGSEMLLGRMVATFGQFGEIMATTVELGAERPSTAEGGDDEVGHTWGLVTFACREAAELAIAFSTHTEQPDDLAALMGHLEPSEALAPDAKPFGDAELEVRRINRHHALQSAGRMKAVMAEHEIQMEEHSLAHRKAQMGQGNPLEVGAFALDGAPLPHRAPELAFTQEARERETKRLGKRIESQQQKVQLIKEWGYGEETDDEVRARESQIAADQQMIVRMRDSAKNDEQAVWDLAMAKVRSMDRSSRRGASEDTPSVVSSTTSVAEIKAARERAWRSKQRRRKKAQQEAERLAAEMEPSSNPTSSRMEELLEEQQMRLEQERLFQLEPEAPPQETKPAGRPRRKTHGRELRPTDRGLHDRPRVRVREPARDAEQDPEASAAVATALPKLAGCVVQREISSWTARVSQPAQAELTVPPITPGTKKRLRFMDWQRAKAERADASAHASPRVMELHSQVAEAKAALRLRDYVTAAAIVDRCIVENPKVRKLHTLRALVDTKAGAEDNYTRGSSDHVVAHGRHSLHKNALRHSERAIALSAADADARSYARRSQAQSLLGDGHSVGALKSADAALLIEPADRKNQAAFKQRVAAARRDRSFRDATSSTPAVQKGPKYPTHGALSPAFAAASPAP